MSDSSDWSRDYNDGKLTGVGSGTAGALGALERQQAEDLKPETVPPRKPDVVSEPVDTAPPGGLPTVAVRDRPGLTTTKLVMLTAAFLATAWLIFTYTTWPAWTWITSLAAAAVCACPPLFKVLALIVEIIGEALEALVSLLRVLLVLAIIGIVIASIVYAVNGSPS